MAECANLYCSASLETPLSKAVWKNDLEEVKSLLQDDFCDVNAVVTKDGVRPIHMAASRVNGIEVLDALVGRGAKVDSRTARPTWNTPMLEAILYSRVEHVEYLLGKGLKVNAALDSRNRTPLHVLARKECAPVMLKILLDQGANSNVFDDDGYTPVHFAAMDPKCYQPHVMRQLLTTGKGDPSLLTRNKMGFNVIQMAVACENIRAVEDLAMVHKVDLEQVDKCGRTTLCMAIDAYVMTCEKAKANRSTRGLIGKIIKVLCQAGAKVDMTRTGEDENESHLGDLIDTLHFHKDTDLVKLLLDHGANPNANSHDMSLLSFAVVTYNLNPQLRPQTMEVIGLLLKAKANPKAFDIKLHCTKIPVLYFLVFHDHAEVLAVFMDEGGVDPNSKLALPVITAENAFLFKRLSDLRQSSSEERPAYYSLLHYAVNFKSNNVAEYLVNHPRVDLKSTEGCGMTVLDLSIRVRNTKATKLIKQKLKNRRK